MRRAFRWISRGLLALLALIVVAAGGGYIWLRTSLPQVDGAVTVAGLSAPVEIARDDRGVPTIAAKSLDDAYFAIGFAHAQDRLFQMELMRRVGAGRLAEAIGTAGLATDKLMRTLGLYRLAEAQADAASPALKAALDAYAAGVNAFLKGRRGALPLAFQLLRIEPEPWRPADSLVWGRIMALQLSANWREEAVNRALQKALPADLFQLLLPEAKSLAGLPTPWFGRSNLASNNWVIGPQKSRSGAPLLANDPHLSLSAPSVWYLVHVVTPDRQWVGATSPGLPLIVIGASDRVAWGLTTTSGDTEDLFKEKAVEGDPGLYQTPGGSARFALRKDQGQRRRGCRDRRAQHPSRACGLRPRCGPQGRRAGARALRGVPAAGRPHGRRALRHEHGALRRGIPRRARGFPCAAAECGLRRSRGPYRLRRCRPRPGAPQGLRRGPAAGARLDGRV
jgi:penicillin amidase